MKEKKDVKHLLKSFINWLKSDPIGLAINIVISALLIYYCIQIQETKKACYECEGRLGCHPDGGLYDLLDEHNQNVTGYVYSLGHYGVVNVNEDNETLSESE